MVMVSFDRDFVFLKTRKTAGTSIEMALEPFCRPAGARITEETPIRRSRHGIVGRRVADGPGWLDRLLRRTDWHNHMPAREVRDALGLRRWARIRKITSVRNPFDLAVSRYHWQLMRKGLPEAADFAETRRNFRAMLEAGKRVIDVDHDIVHIDGVLVTDHILRFEHLAEDLDRVAGELDLARSLISLPHTKQTSHRRARPTADYFDETCAEIVRRSAAWVFDRFDYALHPRETLHPASLCS